MSIAKKSPKMANYEIPEDTNFHEDKYSTMSIIITKKDNSSIISSAAKEVSTKREDLKTPRLDEGDRKILRNITQRLSNYLMYRGRVKHCCKGKCILGWRPIMSISTITLLNYPWLMLIGNSMKVIIKYDN